jgi:hypothetical protein
MRTVKIELLQAPMQQIVRPFPGKDAQLRGADGEVVRDTPIELRYISPSAVPISPPLGEPSKRTEPLTNLGLAGHGSLHRLGLRITFYLPTHYFAIGVSTRVSA